MNNEEIKEIDNAILGLFNTGKVEIFCSKCKKPTIPEIPIDLKRTPCCGEEVIVKIKEK